MLDILFLKMLTKCNVLYFPILILIAGCYSVLNSGLTNEKYFRCRLHDRSFASLCCLSEPSLIMSDVESLTKCAALCSRYDGQKNSLAFSGPAPAIRRLNTGPPYSTTGDQPPRLNGYVRFSRKVCIGFNYKLKFNTCEIFNGRNKYEVVHGHQMCAFYQKLNPKSPACWISEYKDCDELPLLTPDDSGLYWITISTSMKVVYCEITTEGRVYTIFSRRSRGLLRFDRKWVGYADGFGNLRDEFWMGNKFFEQITSRDNYTLRIEFKLSNDEVPLHADYTNVTISENKFNFGITFGSYSGTAGDALSHHNGMAFTTLDKDNDYNSSINCAKLFRSGWWYNNCKKCDLNAPYCNDTNTCANWLNYNLGFNFVQMKVARNK